MLSCWCALHNTLLLGISLMLPAISTPARFSTHLCEGQLVVQLQGLQRPGDLGRVGSHHPRDPLPQQALSALGSCVNAGVCLRTRVANMLSVCSAAQPHPWRQCEQSVCRHPKIGVSNAVVGCLLEQMKRCMPQHHGPIDAVQHAPRWPGRRNNTLPVADGRTHQKGRSPGGTCGRPGAAPA